MKKTALLSVLALSLVSSISAAESPSFLKDFNIGTEGIYKFDLSTGDKSWGAALVTGFQLNKYVGVNVRSITYEGTDFWGNRAIDENQANVTANLFKNASGKLFLNGEAGYARSWSAEDNGVNVGGNIKYNFTKNISASAGVVYQLWNKEGNTLLIPFGIGYSF